MPTLSSCIMSAFVLFCALRPGACFIKAESNRKLVGESNTEQESPPAWTQEAYRPLCSKYSLCCPNWVPPRGGYPVRYHPGGVPGPPPRGGTRSGTPPGVPRPPPPGGGAGGYPEPPPGGVPGPPRGGTWSGTPRGGTRTPPGGYLDTPGGVPGQVPPPGGYPDPPSPPLWTDKHLWKQYLPVVLRTRAVIIWFMWTCVQWCLCWCLFWQIRTAV